MLEKEIELAVVKYARERNWLTYKFMSPNHRSVPDRIFISPKGQVVFIEFKRRGLLPTAGQAREHAKLIQQRQIVMVVDNVETGKKIIDNLE